MRFRDSGNAGAIELRNEVLPPRGRDKAGGSQTDSGHIFCPPLPNVASPAAGWKRDERRDPPTPARRPR